MDACVRFYQHRIRQPLRWSSRMRIRRPCLVMTALTLKSRVSITGERFRFGVFAVLCGRNRRRMGSHPRIIGLLVPVICSRCVYRRSMGWF